MPAESSDITARGWDQKVSYLAGVNRPRSELPVDAPETDYEDRRITSTSTSIVIRGYYFPMGRAKVVSYDQIRGVAELSLGRLSGKGRVWGTANPRVWANLDPRRPHKSTGFVLDIGKSVRPFVTPDDPAAFRQVLERHGLSVVPGGSELI
jgi:hypothetical protein